MLVGFNECWGFLGFTLLIYSIQYLCMKCSTLYVDVVMSAGGALCCALELLARRQKNIKEFHSVSLHTPPRVEELPNLHEVVAPTFLSQGRMIERNTHSWAKVGWGSCPNNPLTVSYSHISHLDSANPLCSPVC